MLLQIVLIQNSQLNTLQMMVGKFIPLTMLDGFESFFKLIVNSTTSTKERLTLDIQFATKEFYNVEIDDVGWITSDHSVAGGLTKMKRRNALKQLLGGILTIKVEQCLFQKPGSPIAEKFCHNFHQRKTGSVNFIEDSSVTSG